MVHVPHCPDSRPNKDHVSCWVPRIQPEDIDVVEWLKQEMMDGLEHQLCHEVYGPMLYGLDEDGMPLYHVFRHPGTGTWMVKGKEG